MSSTLIAIIIIGDILVCGFLIALVTWLFVRIDKKTLDKTAAIVLLDDDASWHNSSYTTSVDNDSKAS